MPSRSGRGRRHRCAPDSGVRRRAHPGRDLRPVDELPDRLAEIPPDVDIVAYCRGPYCVSAYDAVRLLVHEGRRVVRLVDGMVEWRLDGRPVEVDAA